MNTGTGHSSVVRALILLLLTLCLCSECILDGNRHILGRAFDDLTGALCDPGSQWMTFFCAGIYFVAIILLRLQIFATGGPSARSIWLLVAELCLVAVGAIASLAYGMSYASACGSTYALVFLGSSTLGQGVGLLKSTNEREEIGSCGVTIIGLLILLAIAALWVGKPQDFYQYGGTPRMCGPWDDPNIFGMFMAIGVVLALGSLMAEVLSPRSWRGSASWRCWVRGAALLAAAVVMGVRLVNSYSRAAWVGAMVGFAYLAWQGGKAERVKIEMLKVGRCWIILGLICACMQVLAFWSFRDNQRLVLRRVFSACNENDFSWRNRIAAYEGALQMLAERPWFGFGWNQPARVYGEFYCRPKVDEGIAMQLNDYLLVGTTLGIPALACFGIYVWLTACQKSPIANGRWPRTEAEWLRAVCLAGALVLLVGFWFDGGLFKLATGATFWILLELGREDLEGLKRSSFGA